MNSAFDFIVCFNTSCFYGPDNTPKKEKIEGKRLWWSTIFYKRKNAVQYAIH